MSSTYLRRAVAIVVLAMSLLPGLAVDVYAASVAVYEYPGEVSGRISALGYDTVQWTSPTQVTSASLADVNLLFVHTKKAAELADKSSLIADWVFQGNGLVVEQPNIRGLVDILPPGLDIYVASREYDGSHTDPDPVRAVAITTLGATHPITAGLTTEELCENGDRVLLSDVSSSYSILGVQQTNSYYVALAAATYGTGRVVFHTGNTSLDAFVPGSDKYVHRMIDWAGNFATVPEPTTPVLLTSGMVWLAGSLRRRQNG